MSAPQTHPPPPTPLITEDYEGGKLLITEDEEI